MSEGNKHSKRGRKPFKRVGLSMMEELRLRRAKRRVAPSEPWVDAQFPTFTDVDCDGQEITYRFHDPRVFPPGGKETAMRRCSRCGRWTPPTAMEQGICIDHGKHVGWGESPSAVAIRALQHRNLRLSENPLPSEEVEELQEEIRVFEECQPEPPADEQS